MRVPADKVNHEADSYAPFSCTYTPQLPELLLHLNCSLAISTYQAGKLIFLSPADENRLIQLPRSFDTVMGIALQSDGSRMALACRNEILLFSNSRELAAHYPKAPLTYDNLFMPRVTYHTGPLDIHDLNMDAKGNFFAVNTLFSCIMKVDGFYSFTPYWIPPFIDRLASEDRCHLNGMAFSNGKPKYATAFNRGNTARSWRADGLHTGVVMDMETNEVVCEQLAMPHSPRVFNKQLYLLLSASGELVRVDPARGRYETIFRTEGFLRGMSLYKDYLFIGLSKIRKNSSIFGDLPVAGFAREAGILVVHLPTGSLAGKVTYLTSLDEIYDVQVLPGMLRPNILNASSPDHLAGLMVPEATFWARPED